MVDVDDVQHSLAGGELVERLRSDELESLRSEVAAGRREHILRALDQRGTAQELIRQQYTGRYPFELLQNADDAAAALDGGTVRFHLTPGALIVADQGSGFGSEEIRAICGLGRSSKDASKAIGYKGLGFKSVGEITERPQVVSTAARFRFDESAVRSAVEGVVGAIPAEQRLPVYAFPFPLDDADLGDDKGAVRELVTTGFRSVLRFPFKTVVHRDIVDEHLHSTLSPRLLLLLAHTERLEVTGTSRDFRATIVREAHRDCVEALLDVDAALEHWLVFTNQIPIPDRALTERLGDTWKTVGRVSVSAAVRLGPDGRPDHGVVQPLHVYFPTVERSGLPLILHGDFALELDRRHVSRTPEAAPYNDWLADELADMVADTVAPSLSTRFSADARVVRALAPAGSPSDFGESVYAKVIERLATARFIPAVDGRARLPGEVALLPDSIPDAAEAHRLLDLEGLGRLAIAGVEEHAPSRQLLTRYLGVTPLDVRDAANRLAEPAVDGDQAVYSFLVRWADKLGASRLGAALAEVRCVRTMGGSWAAPGSGLFFGRKREELDLPSDLDIPIVDIPDVPGLVGLLQDAGVRPFEWRQLLPEFVLPLLTAADTADALRRSALHALRAYYKSERTGDPRIRGQINRSLLSAKSIGSGSHVLRSAGELYFTASWLGNDRLEKIYGPFEDPDFIALDPPSDDDERQSELAFLEWVGVATRPRTDVAFTDQQGMYLFSNLGRHPHRRYGVFWSAWLQTPAVAMAATCDQHHDGQQLRTSVSLDRFPELVEAGERSRLAALWHALVEDWQHYEPAMSAEVHCPHGWHNGTRSRRIPSLAWYLLTDLEWLPALRGGAPTLTSPGFAWRLAHDTPRRIAERVDVLASEVGDLPGAGVLASVLGVVDAARPAPDDLAGLLESLAVEHGDGEAQREVYEAARWAMRTLDNVLDRSGARPGARPPLLARFAGEQVFHRSPTVALDPLLEETWEPEVPILDADRDLRWLHRAFELRSLDDEVARFPDGDLLPDSNTAVVRARIDQAKPFLAALASHETPSREEEVFRGLARLEVIAYNDLRLRYELDGMVRLRDEAVSYLAVRQEKVGRRRNVGTAHLEVDAATGEPHWFVFGPQLAQFLRVPTQADAFALLLQSDRAGRERFLIARRISLDLVEEARIKLKVLPEDDVLEDLLAGVVDGADRLPGDRSGRRTATGERPELPEGSDASSTADKDGSADDEPPLPPIDFERVEMTDGATEAVTVVAGPHGGGGGGLGPAGPVDFARRGFLQRRVGRRGEEASYERERRRLAEIGFDPDAVIWRSKRHPYAPYDIESLDGEGQRIFIEVKATASEDPSDPFEISEAELRCALREGDRYFVYRVTLAHTATPSITRYCDPLRLVRLDHAELRLSGARLAFHDGGDSEVSPPEASSAATTESE